MRSWRTWQAFTMLIVLTLVTPFSGGTERPSTASSIQTTTSDWPMEGGNAARTGAVSESDPIRDPVLLWSYGEQLFTDPVTIDDLIVIGAASGLLALNSDD